MSSRLLAMAGFDNFNTDFYQSSYSVDDQNQAGYGYSNTEDPYSKYASPDVITIIIIIALFVKSVLFV